MTWRQMSDEEIADELERLTREMQAVRSAPTRARAKADALPAPGACEEADLPVDPVEAARVYQRFIQGSETSIPLRTVEDFSQ